MTSPICKVNGSSTLNGVDVTAATTYTIALADTGGVKEWSIVCLNTDDTTAASTVNASMTVDPVTKTATAVAPNNETEGGFQLGNAFIFRSTVNRGLDVNGVADPSLTCTFGVFVRATNGMRVAAFDEVAEGSAAYGWVAKYNELVRAAPSSVDLTLLGSATPLPYPNTLVERNSTGSFEVIGLDIHGRLNLLPHFATTSGAIALDFDTGARQEITLTGDGGCTAAPLHVFQGGVYTITVDTGAGAHAWTGWHEDYHFGMLDPIPDVSEGMPTVYEFRGMSSGALQCVARSNQGQSLRIGANNDLDGVTVTIIADDIQLIGSGALGKLIIDDGGGVGIYSSSFYINSQGGISSINGDDTGQLTLDAQQIQLNAQGTVTISSGSGAGVLTVDDSGILNFTSGGSGATTIIADASGILQLQSIGGTVSLLENTSGSSIIVGTNGISMDSGGGNDVSINASNNLFLTCAGTPVIAIEGGLIQFFGGAGAVKQTITGSRGGNVALANLLTALAQLGLITNSTT